MVDLHGIDFRKEKNWFVWYNCNNFDEYCAYLIDNINRLTNGALE